ncbi:hypothetical protein PG984_011913 [Apiospora sp. TS-2023a]
MMPDSEMIANRSHNLSYNECVNSRSGLYPGEVVLLVRKPLEPVMSKSKSQQSRLYLRHCVACSTRRLRPHEAQFASVLHRSRAVPVPLDNRYRRNIAK